MDSNFSLPICEDEDLFGIEVYFILYFFEAKVEVQIPSMLLWTLIVVMASSTFNYLANFN